MEVTIVITCDGEEVSRHMGTLPPVQARELELIAEIGRQAGLSLAFNTARVLLTVSGMGLDVFMKEYGAYRLEGQIKGMKDWL